MLRRARGSLSVVVIYLVLSLFLCAEVVRMSSAMKVGKGVRTALIRARVSTRLSAPTNTGVQGVIPLQPKVSQPKAEEGNRFEKLGLSESLSCALKGLNISKPTPVQGSVISRLLGRENLVMAASTGSGKTLAYALPTVQYLRSEEEVGYQRQTHRPRALVLVPTRELAQQVLQSFKSLGHFSKISCTAVVGGEDYASQKSALKRMVDVVVASPGRLMQHKEQGNVYLSQVNTVIIDEVDTMLTQGFGNDIKSILKTVLRRQERDGVNVQLIMATATLTKAVRKLLTEVEGAGFIVDSVPNSDGSREKQKSSAFIKLNIVEIDGVHRVLPHVKHQFESTKGRDKVINLRNILAMNQNSMKRTLVFCNTIGSCKAAELAINDDGQHTALSYHGDLSSDERSANLEQFRNGEIPLLVCTDIAARGLDIPEVDHVVMFDFPLNAVDYIHRAGRCGRAGRKGTVTSIIAKRDEVLSQAIQAAITKGLPIDSLSASKRDYAPAGRLAHVFGSEKKDSPKKHDQRDSVLSRGRNVRLLSGRRSLRTRSRTASPTATTTDKPAGGRGRSSSPDRAPKRYATREELRKDRIKKKVMVKSQNNFNTNRFAAAKQFRRSK